MSNLDIMILAIIFGKIKNDLEKVGDIDKLLNKNKVRKDD